MNEAIHIALACDDAYAPHVAVVIRSVLANAHSEEFHHFHILATGLEAESIRRIQETVDGDTAKLEFHCLKPSRLTDFPTLRHTPNAYLRLFISELVCDVPRIIYLDCDVLVRAPLRDLWNMDLAGMTACACIDASWFCVSSRKHLESLGIASAAWYFNTGVMLIDLKKWQADCIVAKSLDWASTHFDKIVHSDQDILNVILGDHVKPIHLRWNLQIPFVKSVRDDRKYITKEIVDAVADPAIVHYAGDAKPWMREHPVPYQSDYYKHRVETPWGQEVLPLLTISQRLERLRHQAKNGRRWVRSKLRRCFDGSRLSQTRTN